MKVRLVDSLDDVHEVAQLEHELVERASTEDGLEASQDGPGVVGLEPGLVEGPVEVEANSHLVALEAVVLISVADIQPVRGVELLCVLRGEIVPREGLWNIP